MPRRFSAALSGARGEGGRWVQLPFDAREAFGQARAPVSGTVNGIPYRSRIATYGGRYYLGLTREIRDRAGLQLGDEIEVDLARDDVPREVELPTELARALSSRPDAKERFDRLSFTHKNEYARFIANAKRQDTRDRRATKAIEMLETGRRTPDA